MKLEANNLSVGYEKGKVIFPGISLSAIEGEMIALLGVNGVGKSTLLRTVAGLQQPVSGWVSVGGKAISQITIRERAQLISIVLTEKMAIDNISVTAFITLGRSPYTNWLGQTAEEDSKIVEDVVHRMKITKLKDKLFNHLSDGEKQKVLIARALCQQTPVIILDEPTAFLDFRSKREMMAILSAIAIELNKIVILSTHDVETALEYCSKYWLMKEDKTFVQIDKTETMRSEVKLHLFGSSSGNEF